MILRRSRGARDAAPADPLHDADRAPEGAHASPTPGAGETAGAGAESSWPSFSWPGGRNGRNGKPAKGGKKGDASAAIDGEEFDRAFNSGFGHRMSLRWRLTLLTALIVAASVGLMTLAAFVTVQATLYREVDENLKTQATQLLNSPYASEFAIEPIVTADSLKILNPDLDAMFFARGSVTGRGGTINIGGPEWAVISGNRTESLRTDEFSNKRIYAIHDPSGATLVLANSLESTNTVLRSLGGVLFVISAIGVFFAAAAGITVATAGLRQVARLRRAADRIAETDELRPIPVHGQDELARFTRSFNEMLAALQASRIKQAELVADAGHELKTPLTSLRTNVELLMMASRSGAAISAKDREELESDVIAQIEELSTLVGDLVDLAREDGPQQVIEEVDVVDVIETSLERVERRRPDVTFILKLNPWFLFGDPAALGRAVLNLMDNAAKWSPEDGTVRIELRPVGDDLVELTVADSGPGIPEDERAKVFDRFYRAIQSRSMPGSGLGLAIVKQVIARHGGTIAVEDSDDGGALMRVRLPGSATRNGEPAVE
ncbi:ATP-binding protein [Corynebacterium hansenii]|uniref:histidine kinase n=2 Tax=Corynebacterium hansenii TaxID=394964 RepID=A0ABV7ZPX9_9CORY|nr:Signal transduction histidine-protein kinase/phosphatase MprB [Corynebacterium hansenii]